VGRAVALALGSWIGQGGSRKWQSDEAGPVGERELDTGVFAGVWRREVLLAYGGWDEGWPANQDAEMAGRFLGDGRRLVLLGGMAARYVPRERLRALARQYWGYGFYRVRTARRHPESMRRSLLVPPALLATAAAAVAAPRPVRRAARAALGVYGGALAQAALDARRRGAPAGDAALLPAVLVAMHAGHGTGVLAGIVRFGPPWPALLRAAGLGRLVRPGASRAEGERVWAPSLHGE
jgi:hypothetical protein